MMRYEVRAEYWTPLDDVEPERVETTTLEAADVESAAIQAVIRRALPVEFRNDEPMFWWEEDDPYPGTEVGSVSVKDAGVSEVILTFGDEDSAKTLMLYVSECPPPVT
jgi:hypothetical protein